MGQKEENYGNSTFFRCPPPLFSFLVEIMIPLPNLIWGGGGLAETFFCVKIVISFSNHVWGVGGLAETFFCVKIVIPLSHHVWGGGLNKPILHKKIRLSSFFEINWKDWLCGCWRPHLHSLG